MLRSLLALMLLGLGALAAGAVELRPEQRYAGATRVESSTAGMSFVLPAGWIGKFARDRDNEVLVMGSDTMEGVGLAILKNGQSAAELAASLDETQDLGAGVSLRPTGKPSIDGSRVNVRYANAVYVGRALGLVGPGGKNVIFFFAGPQKNEATYTRLLAELAGSTTFLPPAAAAPQPSAPSVRGPGRDWSALLSGQMLHYFSSYNSGGASGGISAHRVLHLCSDGRFTYLGDGLVTMNVPGATGSSGGQSRLRGGWQIEEPTETAATLVLTADGGRQLRWRVQYDGQKTFLNGQRWLRAASDACR